VLCARSGSISSMEELVDATELLEASLDFGERVSSQEMREIIAVMKLAQAELERKHEVIEMMWEEGVFVGDFSVDDFSIDDFT
jgi:hypothetical protein